MLFRSPSETLIPQFGLELIGTFTVDLVNASNTWGDGYPSNKANLIEPLTEYYIPGKIRDIDITFDLQATCVIQGVAFQIWYCTNVKSISIGLHADDGRGSAEAAMDSPIPSTDWTWFDGGYASGLNKQVTVMIPKTTARYVRISLRGGSFRTNGEDWGLSQVQISGNLDGQLMDPVTNNNSTPSDSVAFFPQQTADVQLESFDKNGTALGTMVVRNLAGQRPL